MSFLTVLKKIGQGIQLGTGIATPLIPIVSLIPGAGSILAIVINAVAAAESIITGAGTGTLKKEAVLNMLKLALPHYAPEKLDQVVDHIVAAVNLLAAPEPVTVPVVGVPV